MALSLGVLIDDGQLTYLKKILENNVRKLKQDII